MCVVNVSITNMLEQIIKFVALNKHTCYMVASLFMANLNKWFCYYKSLAQSNLYKIDFMALTSLLLPLNTDSDEINRFIVGAHLLRLVSM